MEGSRRTGKRADWGSAARHTSQMLSVSLLLLSYPLCPTRRRFVMTAGWEDRPRREQTQSQGRVLVGQKGLLIFGGGQNCILPLPSLILESPLVKSDSLSAFAGCN